MAYSLETNGSDANHLTREEEDDFVFANHVSSSFMLPFTVRSAIELGIFDLLANAGEGVKLSAEDIAVKIGSKNPRAPAMLDRLLRLLASHSMLRCSISEDQQQCASPKKLYSLAPASKYFVTDPNGVSWGPLLNFSLDKVMLEPWTGLKGAIMEAEGGSPFNRVHGLMHGYEYAALDPKFNNVVNEAMVNSTTMVMKRILEFYQGFENINILVDVGGGLGINLKFITSKYPDIKGVNFDLPHVLENAPAYAGVTHVAGDMFESVPNGDVIFLKCILHNWDDEECLKLLKNCRKAIPDDGKVIVVESVLPILPESTIVAKNDTCLDIMMMTQLPGGKERTQNEFTELALRAGFSGIKFVCCISGSWVMEIFK